MIETHIKQGTLAKAIALIIQAKENSVDEEERRLTLQLKEISLAYIEILKNVKEYALLIDFLTEMIAYESSESFYTFTLAQLYMDLDKKYEASILLYELQYDDIYAQNATTMLDDIQNKENKTSKYEYEIPLERYGNHYSIEVMLEGRKYHLMLDTGASYIFVDEDKASDFKVLDYNIYVKTAGNEIRAKLCQVQSLRVGTLQLKDMKVIVAPFKREGIDGLLGMNFFKAFRFLIDQEEAVLYLDSK